MKAFDHPDVNAIVLDALADQEDFQAILNRMAETFRVSVTVLNLDGSMIISAGEADAMADISVPVGLYSGKHTLHYELKDARICCLCPIMSEQLLYGAILVVYTDREMKETAEAIAETTARVYRFFFHLGDENQTFNFQNHIIARYLLLESSLAGLEGFQLNDLTEYSASGMKFCPGFAVAVFCPDSTESDHIPSNAITLLPRYIPNSFSLREGKRILALIYGLDAEGVSSNKTLRSSLKAFCEFSGLVCGVSCVFGDLENRRAYTRQASAMVKSSQGRGAGESILLAEEHFDEAILLGVLEQIDGRIFKLSDIERVAAYDEEHRTEYLKTLESYLISGGHYTQAAKALFVDRGTMKYRLEKIRSLLSCDPDDPDAAKRLRSAIKMKQIYQSDYKGK